MIISSPWKYAHDALVAHKEPILDNCGLIYDILYGLKSSRSRPSPHGEVRIRKKISCPGLGAAKTLAANVRQLRKEKQWTQDDLPAEIGIEQGALSLIENGRANPTLLVLEAIANSLEVRVGELFEPQSKATRTRNRKGD